MSNVLYKTSDYRAALFIADPDPAYPTDISKATPTNLDGKTLELVVKRKSGDVALITVSSGDGITHRDQNAEPGWADAVITSDESDPLEAPSQHIVHVKLDGRIVVKPRFLQIVAV